MVVEMNYTDMPREWFVASGLEEERLDDLEKLSTAAYAHKWLGEYLDEVEDALIKPEWFDACIDAHKLDRLKEVFKPYGAKIAAHDPSDTGNDPKSYVLRHGSILLKVKEKVTGEIDEGCDWATGLALNDGADLFVWDGDGMGAGLKRQVSDAFNGTRTDYQMFRGSLSGQGQDNADDIYMPTHEHEDTKNKMYKEMFFNNRAQYYVNLADRMYNTYRCVERGEYVDPDQMISIDSEGVDNIAAFRSEVCRIPRKAHSGGLIQIMNKKDMKANKIDSPNLADGAMMSLVTPKPVEILEPLPQGRQRHRA
jgi:phage terminase large subunit